MRDAVHLAVGKNIEEASSEDPLAHSCRLLLLRPNYAYATPLLTHRSLNEQKDSAVRRLEALRL